MFPGSPVPTRSLGLTLSPLTGAGGVGLGGAGTGTGSSESQALGGAGSTLGGGTAGTGTGAAQNQTVGSGRPSNGAGMGTEFGANPGLYGVSPGAGNTGSGGTH